MEPRCLDDPDDNPGRLQLHFAFPLVFGLQVPSVGQLSCVARLIFPRCSLVLRRLLVVCCRCDTAAKCGWSKQALCSAALAHARPTAWQPSLHLPCKAEAWHSCDHLCRRHRAVEAICRRKLMVLWLELFMVKLYILGLGAVKVKAMRRPCCRVHEARKSERQRSFCLREMKDTFRSFNTRKVPCTKSLGPCWAKHRFSHG